MRIISIQVFKCSEAEPVLLASTYELSFVNYFSRGTLKEFINFNSRLVMSRTSVDERLEVALEKGICYSYVNSDKIGVAFIADEEYPRRVAVDLIFKIIQAFNEFIYLEKINIQNIKNDITMKFKFIDNIIAEWQNPHEKDNILKLQSELNEVTDIMKKNLNELLARDENLDVLMSKSKDLSSVSLEFYNKAKKANNKCCNLY